jgi:polyisoprenyl-phosphate glycosyltransferase
MKKKYNSISLIIPCFNEVDVIGEFYKRVKKATGQLEGYIFEYIFINDGSTDNTGNILNKLSNKDNSVKILHFAKNHGHQTAITAGLDFAKGDLIVTLDSDLQDPPELIKVMVSKINEGYDIVHAKRDRRTGETFFKIISAWLFYKFMKKFLASDLIENCGDFRIFTKQVLKTVKAYREPHRYLRGTFAVIGFKQSIVLYNRDKRFAGKTKYSISKMIKLAVNAILSFSSSPIKTITIFSFILWGASFIYLLSALISHFIFQNAVQGWTSLIILMTFFTGIILFSLSVLGSYIGRIFEQGQQRPLYWLSDIRNIDINDIAKNTNVREILLNKEILTS